MIEKTVLDYLNNTLTVPVDTEKPGNNPSKYVLIEKTGSSSEDFIKNATIVLQSYANSLYEAAKLNEEVKKAMNNIAILPEIFSSKLNTDYNFTDTTKKKYRYQAVYEIFY